LTPQLEEGLRRIEQVKTTLQELDSRGGAGINWKTKRERWSKRAVAQLDDMACGPACVKMVMEDHGLEPVAQEAIIQAVRGDGPLLTTSAEQLADFLNSVDPAGRWHGGAHRDTWPDESKNDVSTDMFNMARRFGNGGSWIAQASDLGTGAGHFVVVEGIAENGTVSVRDPWAWLANQRIKSPQTRQATGTIYRVEWKVFYAAWTGYAVWSGAKVR
jgi:predicted double-glycine peptidase